MSKGKARMKIKIKAGTRYPLLQSGKTSSSYPLPFLQAAARMGKTEERSQLARRVEQLTV
jgi:hypothetical protein